MGVVRLNRRKFHGFGCAPAVLGFAAAGLLLSSCAVGPKYQRPSAPVPAAYKEAPPATNNQESGNWKPSQPGDSAAKGKWWEIYNDSALNGLEEQISVSNQNVKIAEAQYREARDAVRIARSGLFPTVGGSASIVNSGTSRTSSTGGTITGSTAKTTYSLPVDLTYVADLWGSIRRSVTASAAVAQLSAAQLENARLSLQAELAIDYFQLHGTDSVKDLLERTVKSYQEYLTLTQNRYQGGVASGADVAQAETQLHTARAELIDLGASRAQFEHAIAILTGKPPSELSISEATLKSAPPVIPAGVPSALLERRPDIAAAERQMAAANEEIGIAQSAFYPTLTLNASAGLESAHFLRWISWPSRFWSAGPQLAETLFDAGRRHAQTDQARAAFDATVANYRQTVLTSFQQVEDNLAALRVLNEEAQAEDDAVKAAQRSVQISTDQYKAGTVSYLQVITTQAIALQDERTAVDIQTRRMVASVLLIEALGGGWDTSKLPAQQELVNGK